MAGRQARRYARSPEIASLTPDQLHRLRIEAALPRLDDRSVVSHLSAACLHGLDLLRPPGRVVQVTRPGARSGHRRPQLQTYCATLDPDEITTVDGFRVSSLARTIVDLARACGFEQAVVATDHALRTGRVERPALTAAADRAGRRKGIRTAHQVHRLRRRRRRKRGRVPQPRSDDPRGRAPAGTAVPGARAHRRRRRPYGLSLARARHGQRIRRCSEVRSVPPARPERRRCPVPGEGPRGSDPRARLPRRPLDLG